MGAPIAKTEFAWQATVKWVWQHVRVVGKAKQRGPVINRGMLQSTLEESFSVLILVVEFTRPGCRRIRFRVQSPDKGRFTFSDPRERYTGTAGTTGLWGTLPPLRSPNSLSFTQTSFNLKATRFVGAERADEIVREIRDGDFFSNDL
jgi:hypothetical protein